MWIATLLAACRTSVLTWARYRRTLHELSSLDDRTLRDIGVARYDLQDQAWRSARG